MLLVCLLLYVCQCARIPLDYVTTTTVQDGYHIQFDFNDTHTYHPVKSQVLTLTGLNLSIPMIQHENSFIKIGLKYPSDFIVAVSQHFSVKDS
jgi:hypothetical protein